MVSLIVCNNHDRTRPLLTTALPRSSEALIAIDLPDAARNTTIVPCAHFDISDKEMLAKSYFDCHEYDRCAHLLVNEKSALSVFLRLYALYIVSVHAPYIIPAKAVLFDFSNHWISRVFSSSCSLVKRKKKRSMRASSAPRMVSAPTAR